MRLPDQGPTQGPKVQRLPLPTTQIWGVLSYCWHGPGRGAGQTKGKRQAGASVWKARLWRAVRGNLAEKWQLWYQDCHGDTPAGGDTPNPQGSPTEIGHWGDHLRISRQTDWHLGVTTVTAIETGAGHWGVSPPGGRGRGGPPWWPVPEAASSPSSPVQRCPGP